MLQHLLSIYAAAAVAGALCTSTKHQQQQQHQHQHQHQQLLGLSFFFLSTVCEIFYICYHLQKQERERPAAECDESGGVFGLAHIKKKIEEAVAEANACD